MVGATGQEEIVEEAVMSSAIANERSQCILFTYEVGRCSVCTESFICLPSLHIGGLSHLHMAPRAMTSVRARVLRQRNRL